MKHLSKLRDNGEIRCIFWDTIIRTRQNSHHGFDKCEKLSKIQSTSTTRTLPTQHYAYTQFNKHLTLKTTASQTDHILKISPK